MDGVGMGPTRARLGTDRRKTEILGVARASGRQCIIKGPPAAHLQLDGRRAVGLALGLSELGIRGYQDLGGGGGGCRQIDGASGRDGRRWMVAGEVGRSWRRKQLATAAVKAPKRHW